ncbi:hypothetical protein VTK56DRAFT_9194 [Thermocarpiscus australiensis]
MSTLLKERLERERRVESHMLTPRSPSPVEGRRPSSSGATQAPAIKGLGLRAMEQKCSILHKENFDLKFELYYRREKQTELEERLARLEERFETLEKEKLETDGMNDLLVGELEKRDKALEEAVAMIVQLEARVEDLLREKELLRQLDADGTASSDMASPTAVPALETMGLETSKSDRANALSRMQSFLSDRSENTENQRNVYLGMRGSSFSPPNTVEDTPDTTRADPRLATPALSVLSESSFLSVYGTPTRPYRPANSAKFRTTNDAADAGLSPLERLERLEEKLDKTSAAVRGLTQRPASSQVKDKSPSAGQTSQAQPKTKKEKREALAKVLSQGQFRELLHAQGLPPTPDTISTSTLADYKRSNDTLSKERGLANEGRHINLSDSPRSQVSAQSGSGAVAQPRPVQPASTTGFDSRKQLSGTEKPYDTPTARTHQPRWARETASARVQEGDNWGDVVPEDDALGGRHSPASSVDTWLRESLKPGNSDAPDPMSSASQAHASARTGRASPDLFSFPNPTSGWAADAMFGSLGGKGYSAAGGKNSSATSVVDILDAIENLVPEPAYTNSALYTGNTPPPPPNRRSSLLARTGPAVRDVVAGSDNVPKSSSRPPPAATALKKSPVRPSRARSNSTDVRPPSQQLKELGLRQDRAMTVPPKQVHLPPRPEQDSQPRPDAQQATSSQPLPRQRHYPPTASQAARPRSRGLPFFRRSTGSADGPPLAGPSSAPPTETTFKTQPPASSVVVGIPSWGRRNSLAEDDRASATPPPILRNKAAQASQASQPGRVENDDDGGGGVALTSENSASASAGEGAPVGTIPGSSSGSGSGSGRRVRRRSWMSTSSSHGNNAAAAEAGTSGADVGGVPIGGAAMKNGSGNGSGNGNGNGGGGKRKWLGLGRVSSLRNRGA